MICLRHNALPTYSRVPINRESGTLASHHMGRARLMEISPDTDLPVST